MGNAQAAARRLGPSTITEADPNEVVDFFNYLEPLPLSAIGIAKVTSDGAREGDGLIIHAGTAITWKYTVTNPGEVPLNNIQVTDNQTGVTPDYQSGDTNGDKILQVGETWIYTAAGTAIEGVYSNTGTATGTPPVGVDVAASDTSGYTGSEPLTTATISGTKLRVDANNVVMGPVTSVPIEITLTLVSPLSLAPTLVEDYRFTTNKDGTTTKTIPTDMSDGTFSFTVPDGSGNVHAERGRRSRSKDLVHVQPAYRDHPWCRARRHRL